MIDKLLTIGIIGTIATLTTPVVILAVGMLHTIFINGGLY